MEQRQRASKHVTKTEQLEQHRKKLDQCDCPADAPSVSNLTRGRA